jgi:hypothetical protein
MALAHCEDAVHAEYNALANALVPAFGATLYVVGPRRICPDCADRLRENGVTDVRWRPSLPERPHLEDVLAEVVAWGRETFPTSTDRSKIAHLRKEVDELAERPMDGTEMADVLMILAHLAGAYDVDLTTMVRHKLAVCRTRTWGAPDADGVVEHVREAVS